MAEVGGGTVAVGEPKDPGDRPAVGQHLSQEGIDAVIGEDLQPLAESPLDLDEVIVCRRSELGSAPSPTMRSPWCAPGGGRWDAAAPRGATASASQLRTRGRLSAHQHRRTPARRRAAWNCAASSFRRTSTAMSEGRSARVPPAGCSGSGMQATVEQGDDVGDQVLGDGTDCVVDDDPVGVLARDVGPRRHMQRQRGPRRPVRSEAGTGARDRARA